MPTAVTWTDGPSASPSATFAVVLCNIDLTGATALVVGPAREAQWAAARVKALAATTEVITDPHAEYTGAASVLVDATGGASDWLDAVGRLGSGRVRVPVDVPQPKGCIVLVGGGPGDALLHTVRARLELFRADQVFTDRLVTHDDHELIRSLAPAATVVDVGKTPGHHRVPQREIESRMIAAAREGHYVVRLKGGDPFVFGRGGEEVIAAREAGVPVTVVPGITSSIAVPEVAGVPVTHRQVSHAFTVISGHQVFSPAEAEHLAGLGGTIVVLMGVATFPESAAALLSAGLDPQTPFVVLEKGFTADSRAVRGVMGQAAEVVSTHGIASPAVIVIGAVAAIEGLG